MGMNLTGLLSMEAFFAPASPDQPPFNVGIGREIRRSTPDHISVSTGPDNGAMEGLRRVYKAQRRHGSFVQLGEMFDWHGDPAEFITLCGHGDEGFIDVGDGQNGYSREGHLDTMNAYFWMPHMERLSRFIPPREGDYNYLQWSGGLMLVSCSVANGMNGALFMKALADSSHRVVFAFTGLVTVRGSGAVWYERGHAWLRHEPLTSAPTVEVRQPLLALLRSGSLRDEGFPDGMEVADVVAIRLQRPGPRAAVAVDAQAAPDLYAQLFHSRAFGLDGDVLGRLNYTVTIVYRSQPPLQVEVLAGRLASTGLGAAFLCAPDVRDYLARLYGEFDRP